MKLYLDIDGVLLGHSSLLSKNTIVRHAREFLEFCLENFDCFWLSTHSRHGEIPQVVKIFQRYTSDEEFLELVRYVKPVRWQTLKTEAIDFSLPFYWVEDELLSIEIDILTKNNAIDRWIFVNTSKQPDGLKDVMLRLKGLSR